MDLAGWEDSKSQRIRIELLRLCLLEISGHLYIEYLNSMAAEQDLSNISTNSHADMEVGTLTVLPYP